KIHTSALTIEVKLHQIGLLRLSDQQIVQPWSGNRQNALAGAVWTYPGPAIAVMKDSSVEGNRVLQQLFAEPCQAESFEASPANGDIDRAAAGHSFFAGIRQALEHIRCDASMGEK